MPATWPNPWGLASPLKQAQVLRLWRKGKRVRECGNATGLPDGSVWNILLKAGINPKGRFKSRNKRIKIERLLRLGRSVKEIATSLKTSEDYVRQFRRKLKYELTHKSK